MPLIDNTSSGAAPREVKTDLAVPSIEKDGGSELTRVGQASREAEIEVITKALHSTLWNRKRAAALLDTDYKSLLYKMKKLGIG
jgi:transcriptional regulator with GAF, ATPase, and Fis domain